ncbi:MAG: hypothetical protein DRG78_16335 [Epsilonproteobacteria bacterium]|nr:MAG: hypothetical protein DRG78_16335 [Campylobacterota bacterium]
MALIKCEDCEKEYSDKADACPSCGCPTNILLDNICKNEYKQIEDSLDIKGNEVLLSEPPSIGGLAGLAKFVFSLAIVFVLMEVPAEKGMAYLTTFSFFVSFILFILSFPTIESLNNYRHILKINAYFKKRFVIFNSFKDDFQNIDTITSNKDSQESAMFNVYMEAYKQNADAIVLNTDKVSTQVEGNIQTRGKKISGYTSSKNTFHIVATLVKTSISNQMTIDDSSLYSENKCSKCSVKLFKNEDNPCIVCTFKTIMMLLKSFFFIILILCFLEEIIHTSKYTYGQYIGAKIKYSMSPEDMTEWINYKEWKDELDKNNITYKDCYKKKKDGSYLKSPYMCVKNKLYHFDKSYFR